MYAYERSQLNLISHELSRYMRIKIRAMRVKFVGVISQGNTVTVRCQREKSKEYGN